MNENPPIVQRITSASQVDANRRGFIYELIVDDNQRRTFVHRGGGEFDRWIKPNCKKRSFYYINTSETDLACHFEGVRYNEEVLSADVAFRVRLCPSMDSDNESELANWIVGGGAKSLSSDGLVVLLYERLKSYFERIIQSATTLSLLERHGVGALSERTDKLHWADAGLPSWLEIVSVSSVQAVGAVTQEVIAENERIARASERRRKLLEQVDIAVSEDKLANAKVEIAHRNEMLRKQRELQVTEYEHLADKRRLEHELELLRLRNDIKGIESKERDLKDKEEQIENVYRSLEKQSEKTFCAIAKVAEDISIKLDGIAGDTKKTANNTEEMLQILKKIASVIRADHTMSQYRSLVPKTTSRFVINNQFEMYERIGSGAQGDVYQAYDKGSGKTVAVKCLDPRTPKDDKIRNRLIKEGEILLHVPRVENVNLPWYRSSGIENDGRPFFVMEFIDGYGLSVVLKHSAVSEECTKEEFSLQILLQVGAAVDYLHQVNVIHRDVKSGNVIFSRDKGKAYLVDFGSACTSKDAQNWDVDGSVASGTLPYMSPEQRRNSPPAFAQDIFSFSVLAYECFTGEYPFNVKDANIYDVNEWNLQLKTAQEKLSKIQISSSLKEKILKGLSFDPCERPKSCLEIVENKGDEDLIQRECISFFEEKPSVIEDTAKEKIEVSKSLLDVCNQYRVMLAESSRLHSTEKPQIEKFLKNKQTELYGLINNVGLVVALEDVENVFRDVLLAHEEFKRENRSRPFFVEHRRLNVQYGLVGMPDSTPYTWMRKSIR